jgi:membrane-bound inhibitor of C-type lysozyme
MRNLGQDSKVTGYYPCNKKSALAKYNNMEEEATTGVDSQQVTENQALLKPNSQYSVATVTQG